MRDAVRMLRKLQVRRISRARDDSSWIAAEADRLRQRAAGARSPMQQVLLLRAAIMEGHVDDSLGPLRRLCTEHAEMFAGDLSDPYFSRQVLLALMWAMQIEDVEAWACTQRFAGSKLSLRLVDEGPSGTLAMSAAFTAERSAIFTIPRAVCRLRNLEGAFQRLLALLPMFRYYLNSTHFRLGHIPLNWGDRPFVPGLALCGNQPDHFLVPDNLFLDSNAYQETKDHYARNPVAWLDRQPQAFWRGATTGKRTDTSWRSLPRARLALIANSANANGLFDVGISAIGQVSQLDADEMRQAGLMRDYVPSTNSNRYRYNIDIDGNTNAWSGLFHKLCAGGTVLKVASPLGWRQWYYDRLVPWTHFVPIDADMSDLIEKVRWLNDHQDVAATIGAQGQQLAATMTFDGEVERAATTIAQAIKHLRSAADGGSTGGG